MSIRCPTTLVFVSAALLAAVPRLSAQALPPAPAATPPTGTEPVVEMSPFTVNTEKDVGYHAENTLAGSRLNARLKDTAGSVAVFTKEFMMIS